uniref:Secreted protein n=1 Tax=Steinernema glaseri TaxID=37863 RepID=A0A1I7YF38_9BILA
MGRCSDPVAITLIIEETCTVTLSRLRIEFVAVIVVSVTRALDSLLPRTVCSQKCGQFAPDPPDSLLPTSRTICSRSIAFEKE